jgi:hypothetical protein
MKSAELASQIDKERSDESDVSEDEFYSVISFIKFRINVLIEIKALKSSTR